MGSKKKVQAKKKIARKKKTERQIKKVSGGKKKEERTKSILEKEIKDTCHLRKRREEIDVPLKGNSRLILTIFCIDVDIRWINFTGIIYIDDE